MDSQHLRELLVIYRPGIDDHDEQFAEFITILRNDPALQRQLDARVARDNAIAAKLRSVRPPHDLPARLLGERKVVAFPSNFWRPPQWLNLAAAVVMLGVVAFWLTKTRQDAFPMYRAAMAKFVASKYDLDTHANDLTTLQQAFAAAGWPADYVVPDGLQKLHVEGGRRHEWHGQKVSLLCFETKEDGDVWLFVIDHHAAAGTPTTATPQVIQAGKITTASWTRGQYTYLLATEKPTVPIHRYF